MVRPGSVIAAVAAAALLLPLGSAPASAAGAPQQRTWHADQARVPGAQPPGRGGEGVLVAVLDSWVDASHRDFEGRVVTGADCTGGSCREGAPAADQCTHGTHVAGTVASSSFGVAPAARVLPVKVLSYDPSDDSCSGSAAAVAAGIRYSVAKGARVLNLSLGTLLPGLSQSRAITDAVNEAARAGALVVFAAGNSTLPVTDSYGGAALIVAATGPNGQIATYSQRDSGTSVAAPGGQPPTLGSCSQDSCVTSVLPGGKYGVAAGTSMAAPHVAGLAALLLGQDPKRTRAQVVERIRGTARPLGGAGSGLIDATAALAGGGGPSGPPPQQQQPGGAAPPPQQQGGAPAARPGGGSGPARPGDGAPAPADGAAVVPPGELPAEPAPLPEGELPPETAEEPDGDGDGTVDAAPADPSSASLPTGPTALAVALLLAAGLSTALAGLRRRPEAAPASPS